jgi:hypothetical protein
MTYFSHYEKSPYSTLLGALIRWEQQKQTKDVYREEIFVELENIWDWTSRGI